jgi:hypothetical protein
MGLEVEWTSLLEVDVVAVIGLEEESLWMAAVTVEEVYPSRLWEYWCRRPGPHRRYRRSSAYHHQRWQESVILVAHRHVQTFLVRLLYLSRLRKVCFSFYPQAA